MPQLDSLRQERHDEGMATSLDSPYPNSPEPPRSSYGTLIARALRLRCPACGQGKLFRNWLTMNDPCAACGRKFDRAPGYLLGSIYFNYGVTAALVVALYFALYLTDALPSTERLLVVGVFTLLFPLWFFRYARGLWIAFDERWDPWDGSGE
jgi:uncharacterized protein (DUF983 family)